MLPHWLAAAEGTDLPLSGLGQLGAVGGVLTIFFTFAWQVYKRERDRADANAAEIARLNQLILDKYSGGLERASASQDKATDAIAKAMEALAVADDRARRH